jgi:pilus assembly protein CpaF
MNMPFSLKDRIASRIRPSTDNFQTFLKTMKDDFKDQITFDANKGNRLDSRYYDINQRALVGEKEAVAYFYHEIEKYLRQNPFSGSLPPAYSTNVEAFFHEWKGFGPAFRWFTQRQYADSTGLQIIGQNVFYNHKGTFLPYEHSFDSLDRVDQLKRTLLSADERAKVNREKPSEELKMDDPLWPGRFIRLALWVYPRTWEDFPTISMRRQVVDYLSLEDQVGTNSIPREALPFLRASFNLKNNSLIAGPVGSGKSTFANTVVGEQMSAANKCLGVVMIERHPESILPYAIKGHRIIPVMARNEELMEVGIESLRHDPDLLYMTEMRYNEWEFYIWAGSKGYDGMTGTFHTTEAEDIPYQGAFAVYTRVGGSLKGHLISALQSCQTVAIMDKFDDGQKRLIRYSEIYYDEKNQQVLAIDLMRYNKDKNEWTYYDGMSEKMQRKLQEKDPVSFSKMMNALTALAKTKPMKDPIVVSERSRVVLA